MQFDIMHCTRGIYRSRMLRMRSKFVTIVHAVASLHKKLMWTIVSHSNVNKQKNEWNDIVNFDHSLANGNANFYICFWRKYGECIDKSGMWINENKFYHKLDFWTEHWQLTVCKYRKYDKRRLEIINFHPKVYYLVNILQTKLDFWFILASDAHTDKTKKI